MDDLQDKKKYMSVYIDQCKKKIWRLLIALQYEKAIEEIVKLSNLLYMYNQYYQDIELEQYLKKLVDRVKIPEIKLTDIHNADEKKVVVFYDCFGLDHRGLANIYLDALIRQNYYVVYITYEQARNKIPNVEKILSAGESKMIFLPMVDNLTIYRLLYRYLQIFNPSYAFLYTYPHDVSGIMAFMKFKGCCKRYQINLTDHAFWLGVNAFDFCLEFRDYGASVSNLYRGIAKEKLLCQPYYPFVDKNETFAGYPFIKQENDFIIFSGGSLYKTIDENKTYYKLLATILGKYKNVKIWYAGAGNDKDTQDLKKLIAMYPERVFWTGERKDLFQIIQHVDIYFNTYPLSGGLMTQYAAMAGKVPMTLVNGTGLFTGVLLNQERYGIEFDKVESFLIEFDRIIKDKSYLQHKNMLLRESVIDEKRFADNLNRIMKSDKSEYPLKICSINIEEVSKRYAEKFFMDVKLQ